MSKFKQKLVSEYEDYINPKRIQALIYVDEIFKSNDLDFRLETTNNLRENIFYLIGYKHFGNTNNEHVTGS